MILLIIGIVLCIISIIIFCKKFSYVNKQKQKVTKQLDQIINLQQSVKNNLVGQIDYLNYQKNQVNKDLETVNDLFDKKNKDFKVLCQVYSNKDQEYLSLIYKLTQAQDKVDTLYTQQKQIIDKRIEDYKKVANEAANMWESTLEKHYEHAAADHAQKMAGLNAEYQQAAASLNTLKETRKAAFEAILKQRQVKENKDNYRLIPSSFDLDDIHTLQNIRKLLHKPRVLSMLIWQTFWQPLAKQKFPIILQNKTKTGIYKITNLQTDQSYIGQAVDVYKRWCQHCKAGLGIDTPASNKLYKAIQQYGLQNFTFELLCQCSQTQLNQKEKYFIALYQADTYGYNGTKGNK